MDNKNRITVTTKSGIVRGLGEDGYLSFKGIPYGRAERFQAPVYATWDGELDCTRFGKKAIQVYDRPMPWLPKLPDRDEFDEDCLNMNIYVPKPWVLPENGKLSACAMAGAQDVKGLPVLVEIHGGAFQDGSNQGHGPARMIRDHRFIYIAINYRLGALGFMPLDTLLGDAYAGSGNCGLLDQLLALRWIHENVSAFGGDPGKITLMGSSAGAKSIGALMLLEEMNIYVNQVIMSSGATQSVRSLETGTKTTLAFLKTAETVLGRTVTAADLPELSADDIIRVQKVFTDCPGNTCMFGPVADGVVLPVDWEPIAAAGTRWSGNAMIGSSRNELCFMAMMNPRLHEAAGANAKGLFGVNAPFAMAAFDDFLAREKEVHGCEPAEADMNKAWVRIFTDYMYRMYSYRLAKRMCQKGCHVWQYSVELLPAAHCFDQMLAFEDAPAMLLGGEENVAAAAATGQKIYDAFVWFIEHGRLYDGKPEHCMDMPEYLKAWLPLSEENHSQMAWNVESGVVEIPENDVLEGFPEGVYKL